MLSLYKELEERKKKDNRFIKTLAISNNLVDSFVKQNNAIAFKMLFYLATTNSFSKDGTCTAPIDKLCTACNITKQQLRANLQSIMKTIITHRDKDSIIDTVLVSEVEYKYRENKLSVTVPPRIQNMLSDVVRKYTIIDVKNLMQLKSKHSIKLIQLLEQISRYSPNVAKRKHLTLNELNAFFGTKHRSMYEMESKLLCKVKEELDCNSNLSFTYELHFTNSSRGRPKASSITLDVISNSIVQPRLF